MTQKRKRTRKRPRATQTRRAVSVSRAAYDAISVFAAEKATSRSHVLEQLIDYALAGSVAIAPCAKAKPKPAQGRKAKERRALRLALRGLVEPPPLSEATVRALQAGPPGPKQFPPGAFCGVCAEDCVGDLYQEPVGRAGAMVSICQVCKTDVDVGL